MRLSFIQRFTGFFYLLASTLLLLTTNSVAEELPVIVYNDQNTEPHKLDPSKNKLTALHFWATWCGPCIVELPHLNAIQKKFKNNGFKVIAISMDGKNIAKVKKFYEEKNIDSLDIAMDPTNKSLQSMHFSSLPATVFIDPQGQIISSREGMIDWESKETQAFIFRIVELGK